MSYEIHDPREWRISKSGFTIRTGWGDEKTMIAAYPGAASPIDGPRFEKWLADAQRICDLHNATLSTPAAVSAAPGVDEAAIERAAKSLAGVNLSQWEYDPLLRRRFMQQAEAALTAALTAPSPINGEQK